ncbi:coproporphyrinogen III oxidase [Bacteroidia bacterium]|nr:coproporphyrinogen III oxidase [Bacteroidia bacterium]
MKVKSQYINSLCHEMTLQQDYLGKEPIHTIYFGGGTPSQLDTSDFEQIFQALSFYNINPEISEITLEANPDDITKEYLDGIKNLPFNRISLGIQSFEDSELKFLNRRHNAQSAINAVKLCQNSGFNNISIDLIYGIPIQSIEIWRKNLQQAIDLDVQHISAYHLIYEEGTKLHKQLESGEIAPIDEDLSIQMFDLMIELLNHNSFEHYEISNFAKSGYRSKHNSSYWNGTHYLGLGASAHSYNGLSRQWNISSIEQYIKSIQKNKIPAEIENITPQIAYNDYIITRLRTKEGINLEKLSGLFGEKAKNRCLKRTQPHIQNGMIILEGDYLRLARQGIFISDGIMSDLLF